MEKSDSDSAATVEEHITTRRCKKIPRTAENIKVRIPPFWPEDPELWFAQIEGQFEIAGVTSETSKFYYITSSLDSQYSKEVKDIITSPPATHRYTKLKEELIKRLSASRDRKIQQLLKHEELGSRKPSQFLRHLLSLAGPSTPEEFIRSIWCSRLPANIQTLMASQPSSSLEDLADLADRVCDIVSPHPQVYATSSAHAAPTSSMDAMAGEIAELKKAVRNLTLQLNRRGRERERHSSSNRRRSRSSSSYKKYPICWYHSKFGSQATRCSKPCDYGRAGNSQSGR